MTQIVNSVGVIEMWRCIFGCHDPYIEITEVDIFGRSKVSILVSVYCKRCHIRLTDMKYGNTPWWMG